MRGPESLLAAGGAVMGVGGLVAAVSFAYSVICFEGDDDEDPPRLAAAPLTLPLPQPFHEMESIASSAARACIDCKAVLCIVVTTDGENARLVTKYRPHVPVVVVSPTHSVVQEASARFGQYGCLVPDIQNIFGKDGPVKIGLDMAKKQKLILPSGGQVVVVADSVTGMYFLSSFTVEQARLVDTCNNGRTA
eukprot:CAMPEP_0173431524 /NCGR_PEP_ID=MMETSP1357-20121228/9641_1 /TAXON_ID=77926 /ORGANISM="Hemiselmis rufescens, Strain PCC563" /LENGTH=191 /DNA_ID=CAMNT_0014396013 /DNA_START=283 /DNA_END=858 /DNA_ORIENTATION=+